MTIPTTSDDADELARFFRSLADPARLRLIEFLSMGKRTVTDCVEALGMPRRQVATHLRSLCVAGHIHSVRSGPDTYYCVADERLELIGLARGLATENLVEIFSCCRIDEEQPDNH